jgi:hypothetical protein
VLPDILARPYVDLGALRRVSVRGSRLEGLGEHRLDAVVRADERERRILSYFLAAFVTADRPVRPAHLP